ncbi:MAG: valine--tRNA ligase, partial [Minisyncoccia bacterium]
AYTMDEKFLKPYQPGETEARVYKAWEESGYFNPDNLPAALLSQTEGKAFTIVMPPPNANGDLHAGHALFVALQDTLIRYKRMRGYRALWIPGADHAGFETQVVYEKKLEKEGRSRFGMEPKALYDEILAFTLENKKNMVAQLRALGASCDWSREKFTLDPDVVESVQKTFIKMFDDELVYRGARTVNWCPKHQTSLSDVETESEEETTPFYTFRYGPFEIGTVRPETKFGDKYVVMHPDDDRYSAWRHGQTLTVEWINGPITATVIKDHAVDREFGTGVMTITPWHSQIDFEIAKRHALSMEQIIDWRGKLLPGAAEFVGMNIKEARPKIVEKLAAKGLLVSTDEKYRTVVKKCYKCQSMIEPQVKDQWFVKMAPLSNMAITAANKGDVRFIPEHEEKIFRHWMEHTLDWNISRQIVWGIPIPAWHKEGEWRAARTSPGEGWEQDHDTFDTWFSSGQWPLLTTGYPDGKDAGYYPTALLETGRDIIFFWVARMIIFGLYLSDQVPFPTVYLHGLVNDAKGKKMSKSKGNVINPLDLTDKYGTDALRMALVVGNAPGTDLALQEDKVRGYKHFANKLWNIARFVLGNAGDADTSVVLDASDTLLREEVEDLARAVTFDLERYHMHLAAEKIYHYVWDRFAAEILEDSKLIIGSHDKPSSVPPSSIASRKAVLMYILKTSLRLLHPFMPFVTEEIYQSLPQKESDLLMTTRWPVRIAE